MEFGAISKVSFLDFLNMEEDFISLDISVRATGWVRWYNKELTYGTFSITASKKDDVARRREFREFLKGLFDGKHYSIVLVEDVIGSINFETAKILYQLNPIVDDMIADGVLSANKVIREDNNKWKSMLRQAVGYSSSITGVKDVKAEVQACLHDIGFGSPDAGIAEGVYDALGMAVGNIFRRKVLNQKDKPVKLKTDITKKMYKLKQFSDVYEAFNLANEIGGHIHQADFTNFKKDLKFNFKRLVEDIGDDTRIFVITIPTCKMGAVALDRGLDLNLELSHLVVYR